MGTSRKHSTLRPKIILAAVSVAAFCLMAAGCGRQGGTITAPAAGGPAAVKKGTLTIQNLPSKTKVYINGQLRTAGQSTFQLDPGSYTVSAERSGFMLDNANDLLQVTVTADHTTTKTIVFTQLIPPVLPEF